MSRRTPRRTRSRPRRGDAQTRSMASRRDQPTLRAKPARRDRGKQIARVERSVDRPVKSSRRRIRRFTVIALVGSTLVIALVAGSQWLLRQSFFRVQHVTFVGLHHESNARILAASGLWAHPTMVGISASSIEQNLRGFHWISGLSISKHWPDSLVVIVHEGTAIAVAFDARHVLQYVDRFGRDLGPAPLHANLPTLHFVGATSDAWPYQHAGYGAALVASQLPRAFGAQVSVVLEDSKGSVELKMTTPVSFVLGPPTDLNAKFVAIASVIAHSTLGLGDVVDVTVPQELAVSGPPPS